MYNNYRPKGVVYEKIKRVLAGLVALTLWWLSIKFSVGGFGDGISENEIWIGWVLGFSVTVIQIVWNGLKSKANLTLWVLGLSSYLYGICTNIIGIILWRGDTLNTVLNNPLNLIFPVILGLFFEISPEPLFVWAFTSRLDEGDFLGNLFGGNPQPKNGYPRVHNSTPINMPPGLRNQQNAKPGTYTPIINSGNKAKHNKNPQNNFVRREE